eukprot:13728576-Heterocapsa_arctica.AAC.1
MSSKDGLPQPKCPILICTSWGPLGELRLHLCMPSLPPSLPALGMYRPRAGSLRRSSGATP